MPKSTNEAAIRQAVQKGREEPTIVVERRTPGGKARQFPVYRVVVRNAYLGTTRTFRAKDEYTARDHANRQLDAWAETELKKRLAGARNALLDRTQQAAENASEAAATELDALRNILKATLTVDDRLDWDALVDRQEFRRFDFPELAPMQPPPLPEPEVPLPVFWEWLVRSLRAKRLAKTEQLRVEHLELQQRRSEEWQEAVTAWQLRRQAAWDQHESERIEFERAQVDRNEQLSAFRGTFEAGARPAVEEYLRAVFERSVYPETFSRTYETAYDSASTTILVDLHLPLQRDVSDVVGHKHVKRSNEVVPVRMKPKEHDELYDSCIKQAVLRTLHEIFESIYTPHVQAAVVNGWINDVDPATGHPRSTCVISVHAQRDVFERINLDKVDPSECIKSLKGIVAGPLSSIAPVRPIMKLDHTDARFVASKDVLDGIDASMNLAEVAWEDFEQLVRELFGKLFSADGAEVRVTQASRDGGVDAVAFDPDPIRGGKFVIQAKRYTKVVPVSAVRDLYGTMINEGAAKGLLVTTAHFGPDSREFVKNKPITLIDGSNLVYLLEQHGHRVRIDIEAARRARTT